MSIDLQPRKNIKRGIDFEDYCRGALRLETDVATIRAVDAVESAGSGFLPSGRPKVLFEGHLFYGLVKRHGKAALMQAEAPDICYPKWTKAHYIGREGEYRRLERAIALCIKYGLPVETALRCASWARFQILADNYKKAGYESVIAFVDAMFQDEDNHLEAFLSYVESSFIDDDLKARRWEIFASIYNGPGYRRNKYHIKLANAYAQFSRRKIDCKTLLAAVKKQEVSIALPAVRYTFTESEGFAHTSLDERYTEENPFAGLQASEIDLSQNSSPAFFPSVSPVQPPISNQISGQNAGDFPEPAQTSSEQTISAQSGDASISLQQSAGPIGDSAEAAPKRWLEIEDLKPYVLDKLQGVWKRWRNVNIPQIPLLNGGAFTGLANGFRWWWIPLALSVLVLLLSTLLAVGAAIVYGVIMLVNRHENSKARETVVDSIKDPNAFNLGLRVVKKFVGGRTECREVKF